ncbi:MAG: Beta-hexosaminidase [Gemmatimonadaceae bacterium]|nr:Beta-hexosaminidase [Gemmatimonadaceae bacterium]
MSDLAQLLIPAVRRDPSTGFDESLPAIERALQAGVGGFIVFGGSVEEVRTLTATMRVRSRIELLIMSDLERGAGQQFRGATGLPPVAALGAADDDESTRVAARVTAQEAAEIGVGTVLAPVADIDLNPDNPIVGTRSFGASAPSVARHVGLWIDECQRHGAMACAKHFPGHGRTSTDSHVALPVVDATESELQAVDLLPFRAAIEANVAAIMTAHVAYPALDHTRAPATLSRRITRGLLRDRLGFEGLVVTDAMIMQGVLGDSGEGVAAVRALEAGCDLLLYPEELDVVLRALEEGVRTRTLAIRDLDQALGRREQWAKWCATQPAARTVADADRIVVRDLCDRAVHIVRGRTPSLGAKLDAIVIDDDVGGPYDSPSRDPLFSALGNAGFDARLLYRATPRYQASTISENDDAVAGSLPYLSGLFRPESTVVVFAFNDIRAWKGTPGFSPGALELMRHAVREAGAASREIVLVLFAHPRLVTRDVEGEHVIGTWGGEPPMQLAFARWAMAHR